MNLPPPGTLLACCVAAAGVGAWGIAARRLRRGEAVFAPGGPPGVAGWGVAAGVAALLAATAAAGALPLGDLGRGAARGGLVAAALAVLWRFARRPGGDERSGGEARGFRTEVIDGALTFLLGVAAAGLGYGLSLPAHTDAGANPTLTALAADGSAAAWGLVVLSAVLLAPVGEELLFRGLFQGGLRSAGLGAWPGVLGSAAAFCLFHEAAQDWPALFLLALVLGWSREATGSLLPAMLAHGAFNALMLGWLWLDSPRGLN